MSKLKGKVVIVTGASKGIGAVITKLFGAEGASVVVNYVSSREGADKVVAEIVSAGGKAVAVGADVSSTTVVTNGQEAEAVVFESGRCVPGIGDVFASQTRAEGDSGRASRRAARKRANAGFPVR